MPFLSEIIGRPVRDGRGEIVGKCSDVYVDPVAGFPQVIALGLHRDGQEFMVAAVDLARLDQQAIELRERLRDLALYEPHGDEIALARKVLDRQIIDVHGRRVVRVHDLLLERTNGHYRLVGVDPTPRAMLRRLGLEGPTSGLLRAVRLGKVLGNGCIPWNELDPVAIGPAGIPLKTDHTELSRLHPADLADIVEQLDHSAAGYVLSTLDADTAADTLQEVDEEMQGTLLEHLDTERAADILERMSPDEAADLLGDLPEVRAAEVLERMEQDEAEDVRELLAYHAESAGGHMTTDYLALAPDLPVAAAFANIRAASPELDNVYYVYVTDPEEHLLGALSLRQLILADPEASLHTVMTAPAISVEADAGEAEVAAVLNKYHLLAVPVVDADNRLQGIVTMDDMLDTMLPEAVKRRLPRKYA